MFRTVEVADPLRTKQLKAGLIQLGEEGPHYAEPLSGGTLGHLPGRNGGQKELQRFIDGNAHRVAHDAVDAPTVLVEYAPELRAIEANWPKIRFHALREHARLVFQKQLEG